MRNASKSGEANAACMHDTSIPLLLSPTTHRPARWPLPSPVVAHPLLPPPAHGQPGTKEEVKFLRQLQSRSTNNGPACQRTGVLSSSVESLCDGASDDGDGPVALDEPSSSTDDGADADADAAVSSGAVAASTSSFLAALDSGADAR